MKKPMKVKCYYDIEPDSPVWFELNELLKAIEFILRRMAQDKRKPRLILEVEDEDR